MKPKFLLYVLIALAIVAIAAFVIYQLAYRNNGGVTTQPGQTGSLPVAQNQQFPSNNTGAAPATTFNASGASNASSSSKFGVVSNDPALDYFVTPANIVEIIKPDGTMEVVSNNASTVVSTTTFSNIISAAFSYDGEKGLVTTRNGTSTQTSVFDFVKNSWTNVPGGAESPAWSPVDHRVAYLAPSSSGSETLAMVDMGATSSKPIALATLAMENSTLQWSGKNTIIISDRPSAFVAGSIWSFDIPSKTLSSVVYESLGAESTWDASGLALLFSAKSDSAGGVLTFLSATGAQNKLSLATLPSKCVFGKPASATGTVNLFYCAVPDDQNVFSLARLPDEYDQKIYFTDDDFYSIDPAAGTYNEIFSFSSAEPES